MMAAEFSPQSYGPAVRALLEPRRLADLGPGTPNQTARAAIEALTDASLFLGQPVVDPEMAAACRAGLWLYHDFLDRSHQISQDLDTPTGSFWHAIMHRREGDFSNAKYWFHRVGQHAVFTPLAQAARTLAADAIMPVQQTFLATQTAWDPLQFVDLCQRVIGSGSPQESLCQRIQLREWELLFDFCHGAARKGRNGAGAAG